MGKMAEEEDRFGADEGENRVVDDKLLYTFKAAATQDARAFQQAAERRSRVSFSMSLAGFGLASFLISAYLICTSRVGDAELEALYHAEVDSRAYEWPMIAFGTAWILNFLTVLFERESAKFQLALLACYINFAAGLTDWLACKGYAPMAKDAWGHGFSILRVLMWIHTTPVMVYLLSIISDFGRIKVYKAMVVDAVMVCFGLVVFSAQNKGVAVCAAICAFSMYAYIIKMLWTMFDASIAEARNSSSKLSMQVLRIFSVGLWFAFPLTFFTAKMGLLSINTEEWCWTIGDFLGKVLFSSSLLHSNFMTIEQRRLIAMRIVEEGNRIQVIHELRELITQKERFMSSMSHELRTPLNGIIGLSDALMVGSCGIIGEQAIKTINTIKTSGARLLNLINDILDASSMRNGKLTIKQEKVNLGQIVDDVLELCQPLTKRGVRLVNDVPSTLPSIMGDSGRIIQIFYNLIGNACKFTHTGHITVSAQQDGDNVSISVKDTGIGIPDDKFGQIFEPFEQVDMSTTRKYGGTGLGLNLVKQLVEVHGGRVSVSSKVGSGTTFSFTLPIVSGLITRDSSGSWRSSFEKDKGLRLPSRGPSRLSLDNTSRASVRRIASMAQLNISNNDHGSSHLHPKPAAASSQLSPAGAAGEGQREMKAKGIANNLISPVSLEDAVALAGAIRFKPTHSGKPKSAGSKIHVLSVDDDPVNQMVIQNLLAPEGYHVVQAMDGQDALALLAQGPLPDVVLLDVMMPGMSGYDVCRKIRELYPLSCVPVIMVSAKSKEEHIVEGLTAGSNDYLVKPFGRQEMLARISAHVNFRDSVYKAGELAGTSHPSKHAADLWELMQVPAQQHSLPEQIKSQIDAGNVTVLQTFNQVTMMLVNIQNIASLASTVDNDELLTALTSLFVCVDDLVTHHDCYVLDSLEGRIVITSGVNGEADHVDRILELSRALLMAASHITVGNEQQLLQLAIGVHTLPTQGVLTGMQHPVLWITGMLANEASRMEATCPPNCIQISTAALKFASDKDQFVKGVCSDSGQAYSWLLQAGAWQEGSKAVAALFDSYMAEHPFGYINSNVKRMTPFQQALLMLVKTRPNLLALGVLQRPGVEPNLVAAATAAAVAAATASQAGGDDMAQQLRHEKLVLESQLVEVTSEANRLQDIVDHLETELIAKSEQLANEKLAFSKQLAAAAASPLTKRESKRQDPEVAHLKAELERVRSEADQMQASITQAKRQLNDSLAGKQELELQLREMELRLAAAQSALTGAYAAAAAAAAAANTGTDEAVAAPPLKPIAGRDLAVGNALYGRPVYTPALSSPCTDFRAETASMASQASVDHLLGLAGTALDGRFPGALPRSTLSRYARRSSTAGCHGPAEMRSLLEELGLERLAARFEAEDVSPGLIPYLDDLALEQLGVTSLGARLRLRLAANVLFN